MSARLTTHVSVYTQTAFTKEEDVVILGGRLFEKGRWRIDFVGSM